MMQVSTSLPCTKLDIVLRFSLFKVRAKTDFADGLWSVEISLSK